MEILVSQNMVITSIFIVLILEELKQFIETKKYEWFETIIKYKQIIFRFLSFGTSFVASWFLFKDNLWINWITMAVLTAAFYDLSAYSIIKYTIKNWLEKFRYDRK